MNCKQILESKPIVHCITNIVTVNDCAKVLLAIGASPTMAHHEAEVAEIQKGSNALVCNLGATENYEAMLKAAKVATECGHPIVIDPVGCGGSSYRREFFKKLISVCRPACIRGNYAEIIALAKDSATITGVDAGGFENDDKAIEKYAIQLSMVTGAFIVASGKVDIVAVYDMNEGQPEYSITSICGGDPMMSRITGAGCMLSSMLGAYLAVENSLNSVLMCCENMKSAGENAAEETMQHNGGTMSFRDSLIDNLFVK